MDDRLYPTSVPPFPGEPSAKDLAIRNLSAVLGQGVIALRAYERGEPIARYFGRILPYITQFTVQVGPVEHLEDPHFVGKLLHGCDPNASLEASSRSLIAVRSIAAGAPITIDYEASEELLFKPFQCACAAANCRGIIRGWRVAAAEHAHSGHTYIDTENLDRPVTVESSLAGRLPDVDWVAVAGRIVSFSLPGWGTILDLASLSGGPRARPNPETPWDFRPRELLYDDISWAE